MLRGPKVQYSSGKVVTPRAFDLDYVLAEFVQLPEEVRGSFLSILAHSLTVDMRVALLDRPISETDAGKAWQLNEWLHHLTSCLNPDRRWGAQSEAELIRSIALESFRLGLEGAVGRAVATAAGNAISPAKAPAAVIG
jgi:hypothetical protein